MPKRIAHGAGEVDHALGACGDQEIGPSRLGLLQALHLDPFRISITIDETVVAAADRAPAGILHLFENQVRDHLNQGPRGLTGSRHPPQSAGVLIRGPPL